MSLRWQIIAGIVAAQWLGSSLPLRDWMKKGDNYDSFLSSAFSISSLQSLYYSLYFCPNPFTSFHDFHVISMWFEVLLGFWSFSSCSAQLPTWTPMEVSTDTDHPVESSMPVLHGLTVLPCFTSHQIFTRSCAGVEIAQGRNACHLRFHEWSTAFFVGCLGKLCKALFGEPHLQRLVNQLVKCSFQDHFYCLGFLQVESSELSPITPRLNEAISAEPFAETWA